MKQLKIALMKAFSIEPKEFIEEDGKIRINIPSSLELLERKMKPLSKEEMIRIEAAKQRKYEENKQKALKDFKQLKKQLERELRRRRKAIKTISKVVEEINEKLKDDKFKTDTKLMRKLEYWLKVLTVRQKQAERLQHELDKFEKFLKSFQDLPASEFPLWEETGKSKGRAPRRYAELEEYDVNGFSVHYLNEI